MNSSYAFMFPGQGSQYVGMMQDLYNESDRARELVDEANDILGYPLSEICFHGPAETLQQTEHTQPAIFVHGYVLSVLLHEAGIKPVSAAGHSLGEYTALVASGALSFADALKLVRLRGKLMQRAGEDEPGTMAAIVGLEEEQVESICKLASEAGVVQAANFNAPGQIVVSGSIEAVLEAMEEAKSMGARLVKELVVSGAFHSPLMKTAQQGLKEALQSTGIHAAGIPVYTNVTAKPVTEPEVIRQMLERQITSPIRWAESMRNMVADGYDNFIEIGPGKVLQGLMKRINPDAQVAGIDRFDDLLNVIDIRNKSENI